MALKKQIEEKFLEKGLSTLAVKEETRRKYAADEGNVERSRDAVPSATIAAATTTTDFVDVPTGVPVVGFKPLSATASA